MKGESLRFGQDSLRNIHISGDTKVLQLCLQKHASIAKRRFQGHAVMVVLSGSIRVECPQQTKLFLLNDAIILEPAEEHTVFALEDSVVLLIMAPKIRSSYRDADEQEGSDTVLMDWKQKIVPELRVVAVGHAELLSALDNVEDYNLPLLGLVMKTIEDFISKEMAAEEDILFPMLARHLGGQDVGPLAKLLSEHARIRVQYDECTTLYRQALKGNSIRADMLFDKVDQLIRLIYENLEKKDYHLLPMAGRLLSSDDKQKFQSQWSLLCEAVETI